MKVLNLLERYSRVQWEQCGKGGRPVVGMRFAFVPEAFEIVRNPFSVPDGPSEEWIVFDAEEMDLDAAVLLLKQGEYREHGDRGEYGERGEHEHEGPSGTYLPLMMEVRPRIFKVYCSEAALSTVCFDRIDPEGLNSPYPYFILIDALLPRDTCARYVRERSDK